MNLTDEYIWSPPFRGEPVCRSTVDGLFDRDIPGHNIYMGGELVAIGHNAMSVCTVISILAELHGGTR